MGRQTKAEVREVRVEAPMSLDEFCNAKVKTVPIETLGGFAYKMRTAGKLWATLSDYEAAFADFIK